MVRSFLYFYEKYNCFNACKVFNFTNENFLSEEIFSTSFQILLDLIQCLDTFYEPKLCEQEFIVH